MRTEKAFRKFFRRKVGDGMKLEDFSQIMIGIVTKREENKNGLNRYELFSLKSYEENLEYEEITTVKDLSDKVIKEGDLLFRLLYPNRIAYVDKRLEGMLIPSQFCIIRVNKDVMDPIVLKWYLESGKSELSSKVTGSVIKSMTVASLKSLKVPNITKNDQEKMRKLITLWEEEKNITKKILEEKEELYDAYLEEIIEKGEQNARRSN